MLKPKRVGEQDAGFTILEVVISVAILTTVVAALFSLMSAVVSMNIKAKERATASNAANSYIEQVRTMNFDDVGVAHSDPAGDLVSQTFVASGFTVQVVPVVTWVDDPRLLGIHDYKQVSLTVTTISASGRGTPTVYHAQAVLKKTDTGSSITALLPVIDFTFDSPGANQMVSGQWVRLGATAAANGVDVTLTSVNFYCDSVPLHNAFGGTAQWPLDLTNVTQYFWWDTTARNADNAPYSTDGNHTIIVECWDSNGKRTYTQRNYFVDNDPPNCPRTVDSTLVAGANSFSTWWSPSTDGNMPADHYRLKVLKEDSGGSWPTVVDYFDVTATGTAYPAPSPLTLYKFRVIGAGPLNYRVSDTSTECVNVSRPSITSTWTNTVTKSGNKYSYDSSISVSVSAAVFPRTSVTNSLWRASTAAMTGAVQTTSTAGWTLRDYIPLTQGGAPQYYYQVKTVITPTGQRTFTVWSNIVGPNPATGVTYPTPSATGAMANVGW